MPYNRLPITDADLVAQYAAGASARELGERFGYTAGGILHRLRKTGTPMRTGGHRRTDISIDELERWFLAGSTVDQVAAAMGCSANFVRCRLKERGHAMRPMSFYGSPRKGKPWLKHTDETRRKIAISKQASAFTTSTYEPELAAMLDEAGIAYVRQQAVGRFNVDFGLPALRIALEVKGPSYTRSKRRRELASARTSFIESEGWRVVIVMPPFSLEQITNQEPVRVPGH